MRVTIDLTPDMIYNLAMMFRRKEDEVVPRAKQDIESILKNCALPLPCENGTLEAWVMNTGVSKQSGLIYKDKNGNPIDLTLVETEYEEDDDNRINIYTYDDPYSEDWQRKIEIDLKDIEQTLED
jgi:hypothetical protein